MNAYLRNGIIALIANVVIFIIGWGCIVPDQIMDNTHLFGIIGEVEIIRGNTSVVFGMCGILSILALIAALVEALVEDYHQRFNQFSRAEKPRKTPKVSGMRITDHTAPEEVKAEEAKDPVVPKMD